MNNLQCVAGLVEYQGKVSQVAATFAVDEKERIDMRSSIPVSVGDTFNAWVDPEKVMVFASVANGGIKT